MAKAKHVESVNASPFVAINFPNILWVFEDNPRQDRNSFGFPLSDLAWKRETDDKGEEVIKGTTSDGLVYPMRNGWDIKERTAEVIAYDTEVLYPAPGETDVANRTVNGEEYRRLLVALWKNNPETMELGVIAENIFADQKITHVAKSCYRRSMGILGVYIRRAREKTEIGTYNVYCHVSEVTNADPYEQLLMAGMENTGVDIGRRPMSEIDFFLMARRMIALRGERAKEADLVRIGVKRGAAQRAFALAKLDATFPKGNIVKRVTAKPPKPGEASLYSPDGYLPLRKFPHQDLVKLLNGRQPRVTTDTKLRGGLTLKAVESYFADVVNDTAVKQVSGADIIKALKGSPVLAFQWLGAELGDENNLDALREFIPVADEVNTALAFLDFVELGDKTDTSEQSDNGEQADTSEESVTSEQAASV